MTAKEFLNQYHEATKRANRLEFEYAKEQIMIDSVKSTLDTDGLPHGNGVNKPSEDRAIRLVDKARAWKVAALEAIEIRQRVFDMIYDIKGETGDVLFKKYIELKNFQEIGRELHMSKSGVYRHHQEGLDEVDRRLIKINKRVEKENRDEQI